MRKLLEAYKSIAAVVVLAAVFAGCYAYVTRAATPGIINYQGRVSVSGNDFTGTGLFKFALVDAGGTTSYWSNDLTSTTGNEPTSAVSISVNNGLYSVMLGDATLTNMSAIPSTVFSNSNVKLRIWFNDGTNG